MASNLPALARRVLDKSKVDDLVLLDVVTEDSIVNTLKARFGADLIYTGLGPVLISLVVSFINLSFSSPSFFSRAEYGVRVFRTG